MSPVDDPTLVLLTDESALFFRPGRSALGLPLWVAGTLAGLAAPSVAIVGSRSPSEAGRRLAFRVARDLAATGVCVVSGLAVGIDAAAHAGALEAGAPTVGVLGGGHRRFFPPSNRALGARIVAGGGAVVSPYSPEREARPWHFLARNAIVAALADGIVVVEAAARSGSLNTASHGADLGIPVMAFPGDVDRAKVAGCLALIRDGAILVRGAADVREALGLPAVEPQASAARPGPDEAGRAVLAALGSEEMGFDALAAALGIPAGALAARLAALELAGFVEVRGGGRYARAAPR